MRRPVLFEERLVPVCHPDRLTDKNIFGQLNISPDFLLQYGSEGGLDSQAHPAGGRSAVQNVSALRAILSNPVEDSHLSQIGGYAKKSLNVSSDFFL